jgi:hypothetical protein
MNRTRSILVLTMAIVLSYAVQGHPEPQYTVTALPENFHAESVDASGVVVGSLFSPNFSSSPAIWEQGTVTTLPIRGYAVQRNASGVVVGGAYRTSPPWTVPFASDAAGPHLWPVLPSALSGAATAINDHGEAVCTFGVEGEGNFPVPARCSAEGLTPLPTLGGEWTFAWAINAQGIAAGSGEDPSGRGHVLVWDTNNQLFDYGSLGGERVELTGLNDRGQFVGWASTATGEARAFGGDLKSGVVMLPQPSWATGSMVHGLNNMGVRVGSGMMPGVDASFIRRALRWDAEGRVVDLNTRIDPAAGVTLREAIAINDAGQIVALPELRAGYVLLTPVAPALGLFVNRVDFQAGQTLRMDVAMRNPGPPLPSDVYVAAILPDGQTVLWITNTSPLQGVVGIMSDNPTTYTPMLRGVNWPAGLEVTQQDYLTYTFTGAEAPGIYHLLIGWTKPHSLEDGSIDPGDVLALAWWPIHVNEAALRAAR